MSKKRIQKQINGTPSISERVKAIREHRAEVTKSPEAARAFLIRAGILTPTGRLKRSYQG